MFLYNTSRTTLPWLEDESQFPSIQERNYSGWSSPSPSFSHIEENRSECEGSAMSSPGQTSNSSQRTSPTASSASSYHSAPSLSAQQRSGVKDYWMSTPSSNASQGYVSPYPPLERQQSSAVSPTGNVPGQRHTASAASPSVQQWPSAISAKMLQDDEDKEQAQKQILIEALNEHRLNTIAELRRVERIFATLGSPDLTQPMTAAWLYYVQSNSLLTELRGLTRNYPFSSECLDEAKRRVYEDPVSNRSWNYCWLVLAKVHTDRAYARAQAAKPAMWGRTTPGTESIKRLADAFEQEWSAALAQLLRYWESPPMRPRS